MKHPRRMIVWGAALLAMATLALGCKSASGSREFIPGKGWRPT